jgi:leucyl aminopeptidase
MKISFNKKSISSNTAYIYFEEELKKKGLNCIDNEAHRELVSKMLTDKTLGTDFASSCTSYVNTKDSQRVVILSAGKLSDVTVDRLTQLGGALFSTIKANKINEIDVHFSPNIEAIRAANFAFGASLKNYSFDHYKSPEKVADSFIPSHLNFITNDEKGAKEFFAELSSVVDGVHFARDLISEPPNILFPESYAKRCKELTKLGLKVEILDVKDMKKLGMNALLGVGQGSSKESRMVVIQYQGAKKSDQPVAFVGKGVTFDTGGISLKPGAGMEDMKYDMAGSAAVVGAIIALVKRKARVNAVGVIGLVENMPDGNAQRPADVVKSMSGQTIEILNTDAEGRLVLADALWYTQERFKPKFMVNLATLTGAIIIALGNTYAGLFSNNDKLAEELYKVGIETDEKLWRFPLHAEYDKDIDSDIADVRNLARTERNAGSIAAAQFLQRFVNNTPWAHLDIAGMAWNKKGNHICPKGAVGFGVRLLNKLVKRHYEI